MMIDKKIVSRLDFNFDPTNKRITFKPELGLEHEDLLIIINLTVQNTVIYNFADASTSGTYESNILTLAYNTKTMKSTDKLMVMVYKRESIDGLLQQLINRTRETNELLVKLLKQQ